MTDQDFRGPSTHDSPSGVTSASEGLLDQNYQECASDPDNFDIQKFLQDSAALSTPCPDWFLDNNVDQYLGQDNRPTGEPNSYTARQKVGRSSSAPSSNRDELAVSAQDRQRPKISRSKQKMVDEIKRQRSFKCPYRVAQTNLRRQTYSCIGCQEKNMGGIRRHLTRTLRNKKPPHLPFLKLCPTCNEDFLDKLEFERYHGNHGEKCTNPRKQRKGDEGQQAQWDALYSKVETYIMDHDMPSDLSHNSSFLASTSETPDQGDTQHVGTWFDRSVEFDSSRDKRQSSLPSSSGERADDEPRISNEQRDLRMQMAHVLHQSNELEVYISDTEQTVKPVSSSEETKKTILKNSMQADDRRIPRQRTGISESCSTYVPAPALTIGVMSSDRREKPILRDNEMLVQHDIPPQLPARTQGLRPARLAVPSANEDVLGGTDEELPWIAESSMDFLGYAMDLDHDHDNAMETPYGSCSQETDYFSQSSYHLPTFDSIVK
ncbi:Nn.00g013280.m01.CDS01 [Neocucurbitaria sp. VM-36]